MDGASKNGQFLAAATKATTVKCGDSLNKTVWQFTSGPQALFTHSSHQKRWGVLHRYVDIIGWPCSQPQYLLMCFVACLFLCLREMLAISAPFGKPWVDECRLWSMDSPDAEVLPGLGGGNHGEPKPNGRDMWDLRKNLTPVELGVCRLENDSRSPWSYREKMKRQLKQLKKGSNDFMALLGSFRLILSAPKTNFSLPTNLFFGLREWVVRCQEFQAFLHSLAWTGSGRREWEGARCGLRDSCGSVSQIPLYCHWHDDQCSHVPQLISFLFRVPYGCYMGYSIAHFGGIKQCNCRVKFEESPLQ